MPTSCHQLSQSVHTPTQKKLTKIIIFSPQVRSEFTKKIYGTKINVIINPNVQSTSGNTLVKQKNIRRVSNLEKNNHQNILTFSVFLGELKNLLIFSEFQFFLYQGVKKCLANLT